MNREGLGIARCTVERLMQRLGLQGVRRWRVRRPRAGYPTPPAQTGRGSIPVAVKGRGPPWALTVCPTPNLTGYAFGYT